MSAFGGLGGFIPPRFYNVHVRADYQADELRQALAQQAIDALYRRSTTTHTSSKKGYFPHSAAAMLRDARMRYFGREE
jgi:hypothetical protein